MDHDSLPPDRLGAAFDVAVAGRGEGRHDPERHQRAGIFLHRLRRDEGGAAKFLGRLDDVIGRHHRHHRVGIGLPQQRRRQPDARRGVPATRLADDAAGRDLRELPRGLLDVRGAGDDPGAFRRHQRLNALDGLLQQRLLAGQGEELLRLLRGYAARTASRRRRP